MASAWGASWGSAWGNSWGSVGAVVVTPPRETGGRIAGGTFSRKRWRELVEAMEALDALEAKALEAKAHTKKHDAQVKATALAQEAIDLAKAYNDLSVARLTNLLEAAASARRGADAITQARRVIAHATAMLEAEEDEELSIVLILSS
jgi:hypothetical protein